MAGSIINSLRRLRTLNIFDAEKLQSRYTLLCELFALMNINSNTEKTHSMVFLPRSVYDGISDVAYNRRMSGDGESFVSRKWRKVQCPQCKKAMAYISLVNDLPRLRGIQLRMFEWSTNSSNNRPSTRFKVSLPLYCKSRARPLQGCPGKANTRGNLRHHFMYKHPHDETLIEKEGPIPQRNKCDMFVPHSALANWHQHTLLCKQGIELKHKRGVAEETQQAKKLIFTDKGIPLERVLSFKYLGRQTAAADDD
jgi:hypothetical protein